MCRSVYALVEGLKRSIDDTSGKTRRKGGADKKEVGVGIGCRTNLSGLAHQWESVSLDTLLGPSIPALRRFASCRLAAAGHLDP